MSNRVTQPIPNTLTCLNLFSGCVACVMAFGADYRGALLFIGLSAVFDFFDGLAARLLRAPSRIGKDLDSLADDVSFGVAPSAVVFSLLGSMPYPACLSAVSAYLPYIAFIISVFSGLRLAKFNNDARQAHSFIGLPVPANALFWASLAYSKEEFLLSGRVSPLWLLAGCVVASALLVCELPMFSLKLTNLRWRDNRVVYVFLLVCILLLVFLRTAGIAACIVWYVVLSLIMRLKR